MSQAAVWIALLCVVVGCRHGSGSGASPKSSPEGDSPPPPRATAPELLFTGEAMPESARTAPASPPPSGRNGAPASASSTPSAGSQRRRYVVAVVGDSLTAYASHGGGFVRHLEQRCPVSRFDNFGKGGDMVNQMRRRFDGQVLPSGGPKYTHVVIFGGVNDLYSDLTANRTNERIQADLTQMYERAKQAGAEVVAMAVAPWGGFSRYWNERRRGNTLALNRWMREQLGDRVDHFIDSFELLACGDELCPEYEKPFKDGIHIGKEGHARLAETLFRQVFSNCL